MINQENQPLNKLKNIKFFARKNSYLILLLLKKLYFRGSDSYNIININ
jgi:hypothetical protein